MKRIPKKKSTLLNVHDFFGTYNTYRIFALQSEHSAFSFANRLGDIQHTTFTKLSDIEYASKNYSAHFSVFYTLFSQRESIHCLLVENKAIVDQQIQFTSKTEKNLSFHTGFLFEEWLYLFNNQGLRCFDISLPDFDYLLLLFAKKDIENEFFTKFLMNLASFNIQEISFLLEREQTAAEEKIVAFLRDIYCKYEVKANQFSIRKRMDFLAPVKQIPKQNLQFPIPVLLENETLADNIHISEEYLKFFREE